MKFLPDFFLEFGQEMKEETLSSEVSERMNPTPKLSEHLRIWVPSLPNFPSGRNWK